MVTPVITLEYLCQSTIPGYVLKQSNPVQTREEAEVIMIQVEAHRPGYQRVGFTEDRIGDQTWWRATFRVPEKPYRPVVQLTARQINELWRKQKEGSYEFHGSE